MEGFENILNDPIADFALRFLRFGRLTIDFVWPIMPPLRTDAVGLISAEELQRRGVSEILCKLEASLVIVVLRRRLEDGRFAVLDLRRCKPIGIKMNKLCLKPGQR